MPLRRTYYQSYIKEANTPGFYVFPIGVINNIDGAIVVWGDLVGMCKLCKFAV